MRQIRSYLKRKYPGLSRLATAAVIAVKNMLRKTPLGARVVQLLNGQRAIVIGRPKYYKSGLMSFKNCDFMKNPNFIKSCEIGMRQIGAHDDNFEGWPRHVNLWAAYHARNLRGDFVECGVWKGSNAMSIIQYLDFAGMPDRKFYLFDTFKGLDKDFSTTWEYDRLAKVYEEDLYDYVRDSFKKYSNVIIVRGPVPRTLQTVEIGEVAYLSIDMNCVIPEVESIKYFWPKLVPGAIVVFDDYGWGGHEKQKEAIDKVALSLGVEILTLPTGQGLMIKP
ncbi:MAG: class I SAM-dependent methyltransferase [Candidatus Omnitrophica bacterium]|nr:class I SAM-dependent methyltransferase [Candidatus Omnitrophota bacterium]